MYACIWEFVNGKRKKPVCVFKHRAIDTTFCTEGISELKCNLLKHLEVLRLEKILEFQWFIENLS